MSSEPEEAWQHRAPYALLLGAMKAGTHAVLQSLWEHPRVARTGHWELHFFDSPRAIRSDKGIHVGVTRQNYAQAFREALSEFKFDFETFHNTTSSNNRMVAIESSPRTLLSSDRIPKLILCVTPWVKMMAIL